MRPSFAWSVGAICGGLLGYLLAVRSYGDPYLGGVLSVVSAVAVYGAIQFPEPLRRSALSGHDPWLYLVTALGVVVVLVPTLGPVLEDGAMLPVVAYFGALWVGGISAGIALERRGHAPAKR